MTIALTHLPTDDDLRLDFSIAIELAISAQQAKRAVTRYFMDHVNMFIHPDNPQLIVADTATVFWHFPIIYSLGTLGRLGQVGTVDVNALTGELLINPQSIKEMECHAKRLATSTAPKTSV